MTDSREAKPQVMVRPACGHEMVKRYSPMVYHRADDPGTYCGGSLVCADYWWCAKCRKAFLPNPPVAADYYIARRGRPKRRVYIADWAQK